MRSRLHARKRHQSSCPLESQRTTAAARSFVTLDTPQASLSHITRELSPSHVLDGDADAQSSRTS